CHHAPRSRRSYESTHLTRAVDVADAAAADLRMLRVRSDVRAALPAADALRIRGGLDRNPDATSPGVGGRNRIRRRGTLDPLHPGMGGDEEETQLLSQHIEARVLVRGTVDIDLRVERRANGAGIAQLLQLAGHIGAQLQQCRPFDVSGGDLWNRVPG